MKLPVITAKMLNEMAPCHDTGLYDKNWSGTALDGLVQWSGKGCSRSNVMWCILRPVFIPEKTLHEFSLIIAHYFKDERCSDCVESKEQWLAGEFDENDLEIERLKLKDWVQTAKDNAEQYGKRYAALMLNSPKEIGKYPMLKKKVATYTEKSRRTEIVRCATGMGPRGCTLKPFQMMTDDEQAHFSEVLKKLLLELVKEAT